jgi:hypothetical protein
MSETADSGSGSARESEAAERDERRSVTELLAQLGRRLSVLILCEAELAISHNMP